MTQIKNNQPASNRVLFIIAGKYFQQRSLYETLLRISCSRQPAFPVFSNVLHSRRWLQDNGSETLTIGKLSLHEQRYLQFLLMSNSKHHFPLHDEHFTIIELHYHDLIKEKRIET
jgi:hypothetical protein